MGNLQPTVYLPLPVSQPGSLAALVLILQGREDKSSDVPLLDRLFSFCDMGQLDFGADHQNVHREMSFHSCNWLFLGKSSAFGVSIRVGVAFSVLQQAFHPISSVESHPRTTPTQRDE